MAQERYPPATLQKRETHQVDIINVQGLDNGAYILSVKDANSGKQLASKKAIVQHP